MRQIKEYLLLAVVLSTLLPNAFPQVQDSSTGASSVAVSPAKCGPPTYGCARSDLMKTDNLNPPPNVSKGKNTLVTPSDFNLPIVRITDGSLYQNRSFTETPSGSSGDNIFNTNDTYMLVADQDGWRYPVSFNPSTMEIENTSSWVLGKNQQRWSGSSSFSRTDPHTVFAVTEDSLTPGKTYDQTTLVKITLSGTKTITAAASAVFDFARCPGMPRPYDTGRGMWRSALTVSAGDRRFASAFSDLGGQDTGGDVAVYDAPSGQCYRYDTLHARLCTARGCVPMSLADEFSVHEVYMSLDGDYVRIIFAHCFKGGCSKGSGSHPYYWHVGTTEVVRCMNSAGTANCAGHQVEGYSHIYNSIYWPFTAKRSFSDPFSYTWMNQTPRLNPIVDNHYSNNAADPADTHPIWVTTVANIHTTFGGAGCHKSGNVYEGCTFPGPLYGEVFGIRQDGGYIRAAHTYNSGSSRYFQCNESIGAVSQSGRFFAWSSDWLTTLGTDDQRVHRCDVFVVNLAAEQGARN